MKLDYTKMEVLKSELERLTNVRFEASCLSGIGPWSISLKCCDYIMLDIACKFYDFLHVWDIKNNVLLFSEQFTSVEDLADRIKYFVSMYKLSEIESA